MFVNFITSLRFKKLIDKVVQSVWKLYSRVQQEDSKTSDEFRPRAMTRLREKSKAQFDLTPKIIPDVGVVELMFS